MVELQLVARRLTAKCSTLSLQPLEFGFACDITPLSGLTIPLEMPFKNCDASYAYLTQKILHDFLRTAVWLEAYVATDKAHLVWFYYLSLIHI